MQELGQEWTVWKSAIRFKELSAAPNSASTMPANTVALYAKDKSGTSALYLMDDAGSEREVGLANTITGTGTANRLAYWSSSSALAAVGALTQGRVMFPDSNGLPTDDSAFNWDSSNHRLGIGTSSPTESLHIVTASDNGVILDRAQNNGGAPNGGFDIRGSRGTIASPAAVAVNDSLAGFRAYGYGTAFGSTADGALFVKAGEAFSGTAHGTYITVETTPTGSATRAERFRVGPSGQWGIGGATFGTAGNYFRSGGASAAPTWATIDHGSELGGLSDDDHTQYALLAGRSGGQTLIGGTAASNNLTLQSTSNGTKGKVLFGSGAAYDEVNNRFGVGTTSPPARFTVADNGTTASRGLEVEQFSADALSAQVGFKKSRNASIGSFSAVQSGDTLGALNCHGSDGSGFLTNPSVQVRGVATETFTSTTSGGRLIFSTTSTGSTGSAQQVMVPEDGGIALVDGITAPATLSGWAKIYVDSADGDLKVKFGDGTVKTIVVDT